MGTELVLAPSRIDEDDAAGIDGADIEEGGEIESGIDEGGDADSGMVDEGKLGGEAVPGSAMLPLAGVVAIPVGFFLFTAPSTTFS
jgi:hypothetical protein